MIKLMRYFVILSVVVALSGCLGPLKKRGDGSSDAATDEQTNGNQYANKGEDSTEKFSNGASLDITSLNDPNSPLSQRVLYFDLDSSQIKAEDREIITTHAEFLASHSEITIVLEGHLG